jgi:DNA-binding beta-propeller fold protein YncE
MKKAVWILTIVLFVLALFLPESVVKAHWYCGGKVVIANRASGTISVIDVRSCELIGTFALPEGDNTPEPMYVTSSKRGNRVFVGDRSNNRVVVFNPCDFSVVTSIDAGAGIFHMWADSLDRQLWVNNDIDNTATVINPRRLRVITTVPMPADLVDSGFKPHDVILDPIGRFAYITMVGGDSDNDFLIKFSTRTFKEVDRVPVGKDPHVSLTRRNRLIYVPAQNSNLVSIFDRRTLELVKELTIPGAHGAGMTPDGNVFYTTNLPGGGIDGLFAIDTHTNVVIGSADTPYAVPHNLVVTRNNKLFLTHSGGTSDKVTIYAISAADPIPFLIGEVTVGLNPFGLAYIP